MATGVVLLTFGEPAKPERETVVEFLYRIFLANARLEEADTDAERRERARELAEHRAPGLLAEYEEIGGSPLFEQTVAQADAVEGTLRDRGFDARTYVGTQFTEPAVEDAVSDALDDGAERLVGLPVYPLCGPSTTVQSLEDLESAAAELGPDVPVREITGWHRHPAYNRLRAENVADFVTGRGVHLDDAGTRLVFSAHGTPKRYLEEGSRYDRYVAEYCETQAALLGVRNHELGYQNHANRDVPWTEPAVEDVVADLGADAGAEAGADAGARAETDVDHVVVEPVSFVHEQSETLSELDVDLRAVAEEAGVEFHRVPVPHDDGRLPELFSDLLEPLLASFSPGYYNLGRCRCHEGAVCLNATGVNATGVNADGPIAPR